MKSLIEIVTILAVKVIVVPCSFTVHPKLTGIFVFLTDWSEALRRLYVRTLIERATYGAPRWYIPTRQHPQYGEPLPVNKTQNLLLSTETDWRYEWLELAMGRMNANSRAYYMPVAAIDRIVAHFIEPSVEKGTFSFYQINKGGVDEDHDRRKARLDAYLEKFFATLIEIFNIKAYVVGSVGDVRWHVSLPIAQKHGVKCVVTEREGVTFPLLQNRLVEILKHEAHPRPDLFCMSNEEHRRGYSEVYDHAVPSTVTGDLKVDIWANESLWPSRRQISPLISTEKTLILYFAFGPRNYITERYLPHETRDWSELQRDHLAVLREIAERYGSRCQIIMKSGHLRDFDMPNLRELMEAGPGRVLLIQNECQALDLIVNADIIIGFQTTAVIESMFTDKPIIYPGWGEVHDDYIDVLIPYHKTNALCWSRSKDEFRKDLIAAIENPSRSEIGQEMLTARKEFRERHYPMPDGQAGVRTYRAISALIAGDKNFRTWSQTETDQVKKVSWG